MQVLAELLHQRREPHQGQGAAHPASPGRDGGQADGDAPEEDVLILNFWGGGELGPAGQEEEDGEAAGGKGRVPKETFESVTNFHFCPPSPLACVTKIGYIFLSVLQNRPLGLFSL